MGKKKKKISLNIDDVAIEVDAGTTIMDAAEQLGIRIPRLCYHPDLSLAGSCRVCIVDVKGMGYYMAACSSQVWEGMEVQTNSPEIRQARRDIVELLWTTTTWTARPASATAAANCRTWPIRWAFAPGTSRGGGSGSPSSFPAIRWSATAKSACSAAAACGSARRFRASTTSASTAAA